MKIKSLNISGIGGVRDLTLHLDPRMNLICGPNGIGKTTILECIAHLFTAYSTKILRRNVNVENGVCKAKVNVDQEDHDVSININDFAPENGSQIRGLSKYAKYLLSLKVTRTFHYSPLPSVSKDTHKDSVAITNEAKTGVNISEVKNWFVNRYLYSAHPNALTENQLANFELAKHCFSILQDGFSFSRVLASSNEIMIRTPSGEIYYEYLSSGFKSCLSIIFGIIKDIEFRFEGDGLKAVDFDGIILIDELELHLHPEWQSKIAEIMINVFPQAQFIVSTHSPHIIQSALPNQIIALTSYNGDVVPRELSDGGYGFQGWSIEEVLVDVMGMTDTRTEAFHRHISDFGKWVSEENHGEASKTFKILDRMLHPANHLRKLLKLQLAGIQESNE
ncbi:AAA family ATPase [Alteromonas australica]|uniref:AAA family ATPase n=1 Tax=Alteromonas australica TaxID=589873 RepID=UPI0035C8564F